MFSLITFISGSTLAGKQAKCKLVKFTLAARMLDTLEVRGSFPMWLRQSDVLVIEYKKQKKVNLL